MDCLKITKQYYSLWLGKPDILCETQNPVTFLYSPERNCIQPGYGSQLDIYALFQNNRLIVSYGDKAADKIEELKKAAILNIDEFSKIIGELYNCYVGHSIKFCYDHTIAHTQTAKTLTTNNYPDYLSFFRKMYPSCDDTDGLQEYFDEIAAADLCCGVYENGLLVSCTDAPSMPYLSDEVQEIGINTLSEYRGKNYASAASGMCAQNIILSGKCPQWSCNAGNIASIRTAEKTGFVKFADVLTVTI